MVASAIAGLVLAAATMASTSIQQSYLHQREFAALSERSELIEEYFASFLRQVGQRSVRPWEAVMSSCGAAPCVDAEAHWLLFRDGQHLTLSAAWNGAPGTVTINAIDGVCPLTAANGFPPGEQTVTLLPQSTILADGSFLPGWQDMRCTPDPSTCTCALAAMPGPTAPTATRLSSSSWGRARLVPASTLTLRRDAARSELIFDRDLDGDGVREAVRLADEVFGFSLSFGQRDDLSGAVVFSPVLDEARPTALRMLRLEIADGTRTTHPSAGVGVALGGGAVAGVAETFLQRTTTTVALPTAVGL